jgi:hypothetical protein
MDLLNSIDDPLKGVAEAVEAVEAEEDLEDLEGVEDVEEMDVFTQGVFLSICLRKVLSVANVLPHFAQVVLDDMMYVGVCDHFCFRYRVF